MDESVALSHKRPQSLGEEIANSISHGVGFVLALAALPILVVAAARRGDALTVTGATIFAVSLMLLYVTSTLYHALADNRAKRVFQVLDHAGIFLLIAGTYTPFTFGVLRGAWGWTLFGIIWGLAVLGVVLKSVAGGSRFPRLSVCLYLLMGWLIVIAVKPLMERMPTDGLIWLVAGGVAYTVGVVFYAAGRRILYGHFIWHLFTMTGSVCHFFAVLWYST